MSEDLLIHPPEEQSQEVLEKAAVVSRAMSEGLLNLEDLGVSTAPEAENKNEIEKIRTEIDTRVELAKSQCEFEPNVEMNEAIKGYFTDHILLKEAIKAIVEGKYDSPVFDEISRAEGYEKWEKEQAGRSPFYEAEGGAYRPLESANAKIFSMRMANYIRNSHLKSESLSPQDRLKFLRLAGVSIYGLYTESSVGVSVVDDKDIAEAAELADRLIDEAGTDELFSIGPRNRGSFIRGDNLKSTINSAKDEFWRDVRYAGQLLFHGSSDMGGINLHGLMSRNQQLRNNGKMNNTTALNFGGDTMHSVVPHFSEFYGMGQYSAGERGGTVAVPLIKIIKVAPYARDAKYTAVQLRSTATHSIPRSVIDRPIGASGAGEPDYVNAQGNDRVFFSSPDEDSDKLPDDYAISMFDKVEKPATYIILREKGSEGFSRELDDLGVGYGFPERLVIDYPNENIKDHSERYKEREARAAEAIRKLQEEYIEAYRSYGVIVPLRRGVFAQSFENIPVDKQKGRRSATKYNKHTPGTGRRV